MTLTRRLRPTMMTLARVVIAAKALLIGVLALGRITWRIVAGAALVVGRHRAQRPRGWRLASEPAPVASPAD